MQIRKFVSLVSLLSFCVMAFTGIVMFLAPQSRVAFWGGWELFGLSKRDYDAVHSAFMVLFLTSIVWHTVLNWKPLLAYFKNQNKKLTVFTPEFSLATLLCVLFFAGTVWRLIPFEQYLSLGGVAKRYWTEVVGSPPWNPADATQLFRFCRHMETVEQYNSQRLVVVDCDEAVSALRQAGIDVEDVAQPLDDIAAANGTTPQAIAEIVMNIARPVPDAPEAEPPE